MSCNDSVDNTLDSQQLGPMFESTYRGSCVLYGKTLATHYPVPQKGLTIVGFLIAFLMAR